MAVLEIEAEEQRRREEATDRSRGRAGTEWGIPLSWLLSNQNGDLHKSEIFSLSDKSEWYLTLAPAGDESKAGESPNYIPLYLAREDDGPDETLKFTLGLINSDGEDEKVTDLVWRFEEPHRGHGCPRFLRRSELELRRSQLAPNNIVTVFCFLDYATPPKHQTKGEELTANFKNMFISGNYSDVTIKVKEQEFPVHNSVLLSRAPALAEVVKRDAVRKPTDDGKPSTLVVDIPDHEPENFRLFLLCLYSDGIEAEEITVPGAFHVYRIADKYGVQSLKEDCVKYLGRRVSAANLCEVIRLADQYSDAVLTKKAVRFCINYLEEVESSESWRKFSAEETELATKFMRMVAFMDTSEL